MSPTPPSPSGTAPRVSVVVLPTAGPTAVARLACQSLPASRIQVVALASGTQWGNSETIAPALGEAPLAALNRALKATCGTYVTVLSHPDCYAPETLETLAGALDANPEAALAYADAVDAEKQPLAAVAFDRTRLFEGPLVGPVRLWRRNLHARLGYLDPTKPLAADYELQLRLATRLPFVHVPRPMATLSPRAPFSPADADAWSRQADAARDRYWSPAWGESPRVRRSTRALANLPERLRALVPPGSRVALYGAGQHTQRLIAGLHSAITPHAVLVAILDDAPKVTAVGGIPVHATDQWSRLDLHAVVVSSDAYEATMAARLQQLLPPAIRVIILYGQPAAAFTCP